MYSELSKAQNDKITFLIDLVIEGMSLIFGIAMDLPPAIHQIHFSVYVSNIFDS